MLFENDGGKTRLTLRATVIMQTDAAAPYLAGMSQGWNESLDRLAERAAAVLMQTDAAAPYLAGMNEGWSQTLDRLAERVAAVRAG